MHPLQPSLSPQTMDPHSLPAVEAATHEEGEQEIFGLLTSSSSSSSLLPVPVMNAGATTDLLQPQFATLDYEGGALAATVRRVSGRGGLDCPASNSNRLSHSLSSSVSDLVTDMEKVTLRKRSLQEDDDEDDEPALTSSSGYTISISSATATIASAGEHAPQRSDMSSMSGGDDASDREESVSPCRVQDVHILRAQDCAMSPASSPRLGSSSSRKRICSSDERCGSDLFRSWSDSGSVADGTESSADEAPNSARLARRCHGSVGDLGAHDSSFDSVSEEEDRPQRWFGSSPPPPPMLARAESAFASCGSFGAVLLTPPVPRHAQLHRQRRHTRNVPLRERDRDRDHDLPHVPSFSEENDDTIAYAGDEEDSEDGRLVQPERTPSARSVQCLRPALLPSFIDHRADMCRSIHADTLLKLLTGAMPLPMGFRKLVVIDCRYPFEYEAGHIRDALNAPSAAFVEDLLPMCGIDGVPGSNVIVVFHCEYSSHRGPKALSYFRGVDAARCARATQNVLLSRSRSSPRMRRSPRPSLSYPHTYLLSKGYRYLYLNYIRHLSVNEQERFCNPVGYVSMFDTSYQEELMAAQARYPDVTQPLRTRSESEFELTSFGSRRRLFP